MEFNIKQRFTALDLSVGDIMYDAEDDVMVKVVFVGSAVTRKTGTLNLRNGVYGISNEVVRQLVLEDTDSKLICILDVFGKDGELPKMDSGKQRFRHLIKNQQNSWTTSQSYYPWWGINTPVVPCTTPTVTWNSSDLSSTTTSNVTWNSSDLSSATTSNYAINSIGSTTNTLSGVVHTNDNAGKITSVNTFGK